MIAVIDFGAGNLRSIRRALEVAGAETIITSDPQVVRQAEAAVLPGDGHAGYAMGRLNESGLTTAIHDVVSAGKPFVGICVGMQLLFGHQEEGDIDGLDLIPGHVRYLQGEVKLPHIGWSQARFLRSSHLGLEGETPYFYFVHSYICEPEDVGDVVALTTYGETFASVVAHDNIWGTQFHPEKSGDDGLAIVQSFVNQLSPVASP
jgi:imidazole glycerol-phosphate synthase subunit HisH